MKVFGNILITGCNRGLGLGLVRQMVKDADLIIATCRDATKATELQSIANDNRNVNIIELDLKNFEDYPNFATRVSEIVKDCGLNVLLNNAGYSSKFTRLNLVKPDQMVDTYVTNTVAPIILTKTLYPLLKKAATVNPNMPMGVKKASVINMSSILGSIGGNETGGYYPYGCSKAALNMATRSMSIDLKPDGILVVSLHPGWVKTDMGGPKAPMEIETSVSNMIDTMKGLNAGHNGGFYQYDGVNLPW